MKKHLKPGSIQSNKLISDLPEKRAKIEASIAFRNNALESSKRTNYQNEYDRIHGLKDLNNRLIPNLIQAKIIKEKAIKHKLSNAVNIERGYKLVDKLEKQLKSEENERNVLAQRVPVLEKRMKELQTKAKMSLKGNEKHSIYKTNF
jgi:L-2-hydroxyglutarate oxidase LhgO